MLSTLATRTVRHRRSILSVGVGMAVACPWIGLWVPPSSGVGFALILLLFPLALASWFVALVMMSRPQSAMFAVDSGTPAFRTLPAARQVYYAIGSMLTPAAAAALELHGVALLAARGDPGPPFMIVEPVVTAGLAAIIAAVLGITVWRDVPQVQLRPDGLVARVLFGTLTVPWAALAPGYPKLSSDSCLVLTYARPELVRRRGLPLGRHRVSAEGTDPRFLGAAIAYYIAYPQCRAEIGTAAGHDRLRWALTGQQPAA